MPFFFDNSNAQVKPQNLKDVNTWAIIEQELPLYIEYRQYYINQTKIDTRCVLEYVIPKMKREKSQHSSSLQLPDVKRQVILKIVELYYIINAFGQCYTNEHESWSFILYIMVVSLTLLWLLWGGWALWMQVHKDKNTMQFDMKIALIYEKVVRVKNNRRKDDGWVVR